MLSLRALFWKPPCLHTEYLPHVLLVTGDFNERSSSWWSDDVDTIEGTRLESIPSYYGLYEVINEPTHILPSSASCIYLIFTDQRSIVKISRGVHPSLQQNWHRQIIIAQISLLSLTL